MTENYKYSQEIIMLINFSHDTCTRVIWLSHSGKFIKVLKLDHVLNEILTGRNSLQTYLALQSDILHKLQNVSKNKMIYRKNAFTGSALSNAFNLMCTIWRCGVKSLY